MPGRHHRGANEKVTIKGGMLVDDSHPSPEPRSRYDELLQHDQYTPDEAAYLLGIDNDVIHQAVHRGRLKARMIGNDIFQIDRGDLVHWLETR